MSALDDGGQRAGLDTAGMRDLVAALPQQAQAAWDAACAWAIPSTFHRPRSVVVLGVGGSALGGDIVATLAARSSSVPVRVHRGYAPPVTDDDTLVIACSFSGQTEETLAAFEGCLGQPGMRLALTTGGRLERVAADAGLPLFRYAWDGPPRSAPAYGLFALLALLGRLGALVVDATEVAGACEGLRSAALEWGTSAPERTNRAKQLARGLAGRIALVVGTDFLEPAARRWAGQLNENAKQWALHAALPEVNHNLITGLASPAGARGLVRVLLLDSPAADPRSRTRVQLTAELFARVGIEHEQVLAGGSGVLESVLRTCYLGDWVSLYLAMLNEVDPTPTPEIDAFKAVLADGARSVLADAGAPGGAAGG